MEKVKAAITKHQEEEYVSSLGVVCPQCESGDLQGGDISINDGLALQDMHCNACGIDWTDKYILTGICETEAS